MRLVDDDEDRVALGPAAPERREDALGRDRLLSRRLQGAQVDHERAQAARATQILDRAFVPGRPDRPAVDAEVAEARPQRPALRVRGSEEPLGDLRGR